MMKRVEFGTDWSGVERVVPPPLLLLCQLHVFTEQPHIRLSNVQTTMAKRLAHRGGPKSLL